MKKKLTIKGMFNDELTGYKDKEDTMTIIVDPEKDCTCTKIRKCGMCKLIEENELTEL